MTCWDRLFNLAARGEHITIIESCIKNRFYVGTPNGGIFVEGTRDEIARKLCQEEIVIKK